MSIKTPVSTKGTLQFQYPAAVGYLRIMSRFSAKGGDAIYLSRLKNAITGGVEEYEKARLEILREHCTCKPLPENAAADQKPELLTSEGGNAIFTDDIAKEKARQEMEELQEEVPIVVDINHPNLKKAAEKILALFTGKDCPPIETDDWAHERIVEELIIALDRKAETV